LDAAHGFARSTPIPLIDRSQENFSDAPACGQSTS
jgi:hypothetical protein